jgi:CDP-paratose synthetase
MSKPIILLTGATGFLGSYLLDALINKGYSIVIVTRTGSCTKRIRHLEGKYKRYILSENSLEQVFYEQPINCVVHTACNYGRGSSNTNEVVSTNLMFGIDLLSKSSKYKVKTFINTDTYYNNGGLISKHLGDYILSKKQFLEWLQFKSNTINIVNLKIHHMYGKNDNESKFIPWFLLQLKTNVEKIELTNGLQKRDFIYVDDVVNSYLTILNNIEKIYGYNEYEVGTGKSLSLREFLVSLQKIYSLYNPDSRSELNFGAIKQIEYEVMNAIADNSKLLKLGWLPHISVKDGLKKLVI